MKNTYQDEIRYQAAARRVKKIKNFYVFTFVYLAVNIFILYLNYSGLRAGESIWQLKYFSLPLFWGIGLIAYGMNVFFSGFFLGNTWEEKKIKELMDKENKQ